MSLESPQSVQEFWFKALTPKQWFVKDDQIDAQIRERFTRIHGAATRCELADWRVTPRGRLAEVIVLDQFSRNIYRGDSRAFASDPLALALAQEAIRAQADQTLTATEKSFLYMPFMHSESKLIHEQALNLFTQPGLESNLDFERRHKQIIDRFGRYPHRNAILNRSSTVEEIEFLKTPGSSF